GRAGRRVRAGGDPYLVGGVCAAVDLDRVRIDETSPALDQLDAAVLQHIAIDLRQSFDLTVFGVDQGGPIEARRRHRPAKPGGVGKGIGKLRAVDEQLFRDAAADDAGATDPALLADRDARAITARPARAGDASRPGADRKHVEIIARHRGLTPSTQVYRSSGCHNMAAPASS